MIPLSLRSFLSIKILFEIHRTNLGTKTVRHFSSHLLLFHLNLLAYLYSKIESQKIYTSFFFLLFFFYFSSTSPPILIDPHQSYVFIVEVAVNLWSPHYCRFFSLSFSLPRIRVACASGSPPVPAPFRRLLSSDFPLFRRFSSCLKSIHGLFYNGSARARSNESRGITNEPTDREKKIDRD